jgi:hypothetical protein
MTITGPRIPLAAPAATLFALALGVEACTSDSTGAPQPRVLSVVAGHGDSAEAGQTIELVVRVSGPDNRGVPGVTVNWRVTSGPSTLAVDTTSSGADGLASNLVTMGGTGGTTRVEASVGALPPASFTVRTIDPCTILRDLALGVTITGALSDTDCRLSFDSTLIDFYGFVLPQAGGLTVAMSSTAFDTFVFLFDGQGFPVAQADDISATNTNTLLHAIGPAGLYIVGANAWDQAMSGPYTLSAQAAGVELAACEEMAWVARGIVAVPQQLDATSCLAPDSSSVVADHLWIVLLPGQSLTVTQTSASFTARIVLYDRLGNVVTPPVSASGPGGSATLTFANPSAATDAFFVIQLGAVGGATGGAYQVSVQP